MSISVPEENKPVSEPLCPESAPAPRMVSRGAFIRAFRQVASRDLFYSGVLEKALWGEDAARSDHAKNRRAFRKGIRAVFTERGQKMPLADLAKALDALCQRKGKTNLLLSDGGDGTKIERKLATDPHRHRIVRGVMRVLSEG